MKLQPLLSRLALALGVVWLAGCSSGGTGTSNPDVSAVPQQDTMVVQYDLNGDAEPDWLTLDTSQAPFRIVEVLQGVANGDPLDMTQVRAGQAIDPEISQALADHIANSFNVQARTELAVRNQAGETVQVVVFE